MITLFTFGPMFGLPDPSPFVMKAEMLLKLSGLPYKTDTTGFKQAPKGKLPYIIDGQTIIPDSSLIRLHLESKHGIDFDKGLSPFARGVGWLAEKYLEDNFYWIIVRERWTDDANFTRGPAHFFDAVPAPVRPLVQRLIRGRVRKALHGQGMGRYDEAELASLCSRGVESLAALLGDNPYLLGQVPTGADATVFSFIASALCPHFDTTVRKIVESKPNLVEYSSRMMVAYFPAFVGP